MLIEALLDAEVRIGELTRSLLKGQGFASSEYNHSRQQCRKCNSQSSDTHVVRSEKNTQQPKLKVIQSHGFTPKQVERFETLANNPDIVEQVKVKARENDHLPTRSRVLQLVREKKKTEKPLQVDQQEFKKVVDASNVPTDSDLLKSWVNNMQDEEEFNFNIMMLDDAIEKLQLIKEFITKNRRK